MNSQHVKKILMTVILAFTSITLAASEYTFTTSATERTFEDATLVKSRTMKSNGETTELKSVSYGLRKKAVFGLVPVRVYVAEFLAANPEKLVKTDEGIISSLKEAGPIQIRFTFLRDIPGSKIADSFKEALEANKISAKNTSPELSTAMKEVASIPQFNKGDVFSITAFWKDGTSTLLIEDMKEVRTLPAGKDLAENLFSIWFGKPADGKLGELKKELLK